MGDRWESKVVQVHYLDVRKHLWDGLRVDLRGAVGMTSSRKRAQESMSMFKVQFLLDKRDLTLSLSVSLFLQWVKLVMIKLTDSGSVEAETSKFLKDLAETTKVAVFLGRAQRQAVVRQLKNFTLLHNFIGVIEVVAEFLCRGRGRLIRPSVTISGTKRPHVWHSDADLLFPESNAKHMQCTGCCTATGCLGLMIWIFFLGIRGKVRRLRDCLEMQHGFSQFLVALVAVYEFMWFGRNQKMWEHLVKSTVENNKAGCIVFKIIFCIAE